VFVLAKELSQHAEVLHGILNILQAQGNRQGNAGQEGE
jgi:hypothetical protein